MTKETMKAVGLYKYLPIENPESLIDVKVEKPTPAGREFLVKVKAISVNPVDYKSAPRILGWDVAGEVEQVGQDCTLFRPGDKGFYAF